MADENKLSVKSLLDSDKRKALSKKGLKNKTIIPFYKIGVPVPSIIHNTNIVVISNYFISMVNFSMLDNNPDYCIRRYSADDNNLLTSFRYNHISEVHLNLNSRLKNASAEIKTIGKETKLNNNQFWWLGEYVSLKLERQNQKDITHIITDILLDEDYNVLYKLDNNPDKVYHPDNLKLIRFKEIEEYKVVEFYIED